VPALAAPDNRAMALLSLLGLPTVKQPLPAAGAASPTDTAAIQGEAARLAERLAKDRATAADARARFAAQQAQLVKQVAQAAGDTKKEIEGRKAKLDATLGQLDGMIKRFDADLKTLGGAKRDPKVLDEVIRRNKTPAKTALPTQIAGGDLAPTRDKWIPDAPSASGGSRTDGAVEVDAGGAATVRGESSTWKVDEKGASSTLQSTVTTARPDGGSTQEVTEAKVSTDGREVVGEASASTSTVDAQGKKKKVETKTKAVLSAQSSSLTHSASQENADGSGNSASISVKAGGGEASLSGTGSVTGKPGADGSKNTKTVGAGTTVVAGKDGLGAKQNVSFGNENESAGGTKKARTLNFGLGLVANIVPMEDGKSYQVSTRMSLGVGIERSKGKEWEHKGKYDLSMQAGIEVFFEHRSAPLDAAEAARYEAALAEAVKGSGSGKEFEIIRAAAKDGPAVARAMWLVLRGEKSKPSAIASLKEGEEDTTGINTTLGGGGTGQFGPVTLGAKVGVESKESTRVGKRKDGGVEFQQNKELSGNADGTLGFKIGLVGGAFGGKLTSTLKNGLKIIVDPDHPMYQAMAANLATCQSQDDIEMFAREYPDVVERTTTTGSSTSNGPSASVGPVTLTIAGGHGTQSTEKRDGAGRLIGTEDSGTSERGATLDIAGIKGGGKDTDTAAAKTDERGRAQLDLQRKNEQNSMVDSFVAAAKGVAKRLMPSSIGDATGGNAPEAETQVTIAGVTLNDDDLGRIGDLAVRKDKRWRSAFLLPKDSGDWEAARAAIVAADGTPAAVGKALSDFLGSSDRGRLQLMVHFLRPGGSVADGKRAELPDELKDRAAQYQRAVLDEPQEQLEFIARKHGDAKMHEKGEKILSDLDQLEQAIGACKTFRSPAARSEMLAEIRRTRVLVQMVLGGMQSTPDSSTPEYQALMASVQNCEGHKATAAALDTKLTEMSKKYTRVEKKLDVLRNWEDVVALWERDWESIKFIAPGIGQDPKQWAALMPSRTKLDAWGKKVRIQGT
jgi:hypothetical protein